MERPKQYTRVTIVCRMGGGYISTVIWYQRPVPIVQTRYFCVDERYCEKLPPGIRTGSSRSKPSDIVEFFTVE